MKTLVKLMIVLALFSGVVRTGFSRGDKIIPQVVDGPGWSTHFDLTNVSPDTSISNMQLSFYKNDGTKWSVPTSQGTGSDFTLTIGPRQTLRFETSGGSTLAAGYAVIYDQEPANSIYSDDYVLGISVFYTVSNSSGIVDTVTVSVAQPTAVATMPVQMNDPSIASGLAIVNLYGDSNPVTMTLYDSNGSQYGSPATFTLAAKAQRAEFLNQNLFPGLNNFKGMAEIISEGPVALLGLLQTAATNGPQYSTLVPVDKESLRRNTHIVLLQATDGGIMPLDLDAFVVDFYRVTDGTEAYSWDLAYEYGSTTTDRYLRPYNHAQIAPIGVIKSTPSDPNSDNYFDSISLPYLKTLSNYTTGDIDLSGSNLDVNFMFAVHTDLGNYAKARIIRLIDTTFGTGSSYKDIVLEVIIYK